MILILGSGRSGTTFLAKLFDSHPGVLYRHEPDWALVDREIPFQPSLDELGRYEDKAAAYLARLADVRTPKVAVHLPLFAKHYRGATRQRLHNGVALGAKTLAKLPGLELKIRVPDLIAPEATQPAIVIKSVNSLNRARLFLEARPGLRVIHIVRHPCGVVASVIRGAAQRLMSPEVFFDALYRMQDVEKYGLPRTDMEQRSLEEQIAFQWMVTNDRVLDDMTGAASYKMVRYEDLCLHTGAVIHDLFSFCGLAANPQTDKFVKHLEGTEIGNTSYFSIMRSPKQGVMKWKKDLTSVQVQQVMNIVGRSKIGTRYVIEG